MNSKNLIYILAVFLNANYCQLASAQVDAELGLITENVVVTGSHIPANGTVDATVIDIGQLDVFNNSNLGDILTKVVGVDLIQPGGAGGIAELFIRGAESNFTVVTIDGVKVNDTTNSRGGNVNLSSINPVDIARVEVLRGPLSAIYGSDALAGAVNVITKSPRNSEAVAVGAEVGAKEFRRAFISMASGNNRPDGVAAKLSLGHLDSGEPVEGSTSATTSVRGLADLILPDNSTLSAVAGIVKMDRTSYPSASGGPRYAQTADLESANAEEKNLRVGWDRELSDSWTINLNTFHFEREEDVITPAVLGGDFGQDLPAMESSSKLTRNKLLLVAINDSNDNLRWALGGDIERESGRSEAILDFGFPVPSQFNIERQNNGAFFELNYLSRSGIDVFVSTRWDGPENTESEISSKISLGYLFVNMNLHVGGRWGSGFKLPSFYALGDSLVGNPELHPETSQTRELFIEKSFLRNKASLMATAFWSDYEQLIDFDFATFSLVNRNDIAISGLELEATSNLGFGYNAGINATYTDYDVTGEPLDGRPDWRGGLFVGWQSPVSNWRGRLDLRYVGERPSVSNPTGPVELKEYQLAGLSVSKKLTRYLNLALNIDNIFDESFQDEIGFPAPGRRLRVGISASL